MFLSFGSLKHAGINPKIRDETKNNKNNYTDEHIACPLDEGLIGKIEP